MKNFFIPLILLFGFTVYFPQFAQGGIIEPGARPLSEAEQDKANAEGISCLSKKKKQLSKDYTGPNLQFIEVPQEHFVDTVISVKTDADGKTVLTPVDQAFARCLFTFTQNVYYIDASSIGMENMIVNPGKACGCREYLELFNKGIKEYYGYDVTDVPPESYLKYIPETKEMQVLPPPAEKPERQIIKTAEEELECFSKKKAQIPQNYTGPNLKIIDIVDRRITFKHILIRTDANGKEVFEKGGGNSPVFDEKTGNIYYVDIQKYSGDKTIDKVDIVKKESKVRDCREYIEVFSGFDLNNIFYIYGYGVQRDASGTYDYGYDVTDVPAGSYLKYNPETQEMQVLPYTEESLNNILESQKEQLKIMGERRNRIIKEKKEAKMKAEQEQQRLERERQIAREKFNNEDILLLIASIIAIITLIIGIVFVSKGIFKELRK